MPRDNQQSVQLLIIMTSIVTPSRILCHSLRILIRTCQIGSVPTMRPRDNRHAMRPIKASCLIRTNVENNRLLMLTHLLILRVMQATSMILGPNPTSDQMFPIAIRMRLSFPFAPPTIIICAPYRMNARMLSLTLRAIGRHIRQPLNQIKTTRLHIRMNLILEGFYRNMISLMMRTRLLNNISILRHSANFLTRERLPMTIRNTTQVRTGNR